MDYTCTEQGAVKRVYEVTVPASEMPTRIDDSYAQMMKVLRSMGVKEEELTDPRAALEKFAGPSADKNLAASVMGDIAPRIVQHDGLHIAVIPRCDPEGELKRDEDFHFKMTVFSKPTCTLSSYDPVELELPNADVSDKEVSDQMAQIAAAYAQNQGFQSIVPAVTDSWVRKNISGCSTVPEFQERIREQIEQYKKQAIEEQKSYQTAALLADRLQGDIPDELFDAATDDFKQTFDERLAREGKTRDQFIQENRLNPEDFEHICETQAREEMRQSFALDALAEHLGLEATPEECNKTLDLMNPERSKDTDVDKDTDMSQLFLIQEATLRRLASDWLLENSNFKEKSRIITL